MTRIVSRNVLRDLKAGKVENITIGRRSDLYKAAWDQGYRVGMESAQPKWISVEERLPEPDTDVLARRSIGIGVECYHKEDGGYWSWDEYCGKWRVTHWMLLPEPPEVEV